LVFSFGMKMTVGIHDETQKERKNEDEERLEEHFYKGDRFT